MTVADFIKDWVPPIGVAAGGSWILFRWVYDQAIRQRKEMPALEGSYFTEVCSLSEATMAVTVGVNWRCVSPLPVYVDPQRTRVDVFELSHDHKMGPLEIKKDLGDPTFQYYPLSDMEDFVFEPSTDNKVYAHFVLPHGSVYCFRFKIYRDQGRHGKKNFAWTREFILDCRAEKSQ